MTQNNSQDWRLEDYDGYLDGETFRLENFVSTDTDDHEHCAFCWQKITDLKIEDCDPNGYHLITPKAGQPNWVCKQCFNDFKDKLNFKLK